MCQSQHFHYLKHSQLSHKYHLYSCTAIQHIKEYHLQSSMVTMYDYLSQWMWTWNKDLERKILSKQIHGDHVISLPSLTHDSRPPRALRVESSPESQLGFCTWHNLATAQLKWRCTAGPCTGNAICFYSFMLYAGRGLSRVNLRNKIISYFTSKKCSSETAEEAQFGILQATVNHRQVRRDKGKVNFY